MGVWRPPAHRLKLVVVLPMTEANPSRIGFGAHSPKKLNMSAAAFRLASFLALAIAAGVLWGGLFRSTDATVTVTPVIPSVNSQSIFAPLPRLKSGLIVSDIVRNGACRDCSVHIGSGGFVRAELPSGAGERTAYALLDLGNRAAGGRMLVHDVIGFGRGQTPAQPVRLLQLLDSAHSVIFELVAQPNRRLYLTSPAGGLRATALLLPTGAKVPDDGMSGVAVDVAAEANGSVAISVNGVRTTAVRTLAGARTGAPRFLAAGVIGYTAPAGASALTVTHAQVSVSTSSATDATTSQPAAAAQPAPPAQPVEEPQPLSWLAPPTISGRGVVGSTLTAAPGSWSDATATFSYAWQRCDGNGSCSPIDGADGTTYTLGRVDRDAFVRVVVTAQVGDVSVSKASAAVGPVTPAAPTAFAMPTIFGDAVVGAELAADPGSWSDPEATFKFVWQRCDDTGVCTAIADATGATYAPSADDLGSSLRVEVTAANGGGASSSYSAPTNLVVPAAPVVITAPRIDGDATVGSTLTADPGTWSDPAATFTYAWLRCDGSGVCTTIAGANSATYTLRGNDVGFGIEVAVNAANAGGAGSAVSAPTAPVSHPLPGPPVSTGPPSVTGDAAVGSMLTADPGTWSDPAATFIYAWQRCDISGACTAIGGATGSAYTPTTDDLGYWVRVEVTATGVSGTGTADSNVVGPVVLTAPPAVVSAPSLSGETTVGSTLAADPGIWSDPAATFTYAWLRCNGNGPCTTVDGADDITYTLVTADLGHWIRVDVTAANAGGTAIAQSTPTGPVTPARR